MARTYFVVGSGSIGRRHFANLKTMGKLAELYSWRRFSTKGVTQKLANCTGNAAVSIATATDIRAGIVSLCAAHGAPMYIEKPLAFNRTEFDKIYSINADLQKRSMFGFMLRYHLLIDYLVNLPGQSFLQTQLKIGHDVRQGRENWRLTESYATRTKSGMALLDLCHEIDPMGMICLDLTLRDVRSVRPAALPGVDIASALSLVFDAGTTVTVSMYNLSPVLKRGDSLTGAAQNITFDFVTNSATTTTPEGIQNHHFATKRNTMFEKIMQDFATLAKDICAAIHYSLPNTLPRMDKIKTSCARIAEAWKRPEFIGKRKVNLQ
ncbi:MAG: hypothetical protein HOL57_09025 [Marinovum sp.]|nr:hypothetical protein [Marinovum sp.]